MRYWWYYLFQINYLKIEKRIAYIDMKCNTRITSNVPGHGNCTSVRYLPKYQAYAFIDPYKHAGTM